MKWSVQTLEGFESAPLNDLAEAFDILIIDHPHIADAVDAQAIVPLTELVTGDQLAEWSVRSVGKSATSYEYRSQLWAAPIDAATQVSVGQRGVPQLDTWAEVSEFAAVHQMVLCLAGPHAFLTWVSLLTANGASIARAADGFTDFEPALEALEQLVELNRLARVRLPDANPIQVLELMAHDPSIRFCPLIYQYVNYSFPLVFHNAPRGSAGKRGSVLGGTGFAVTPRGLEHRQSVRFHLERLMSSPVQTRLIPEAGGQPSSLAAWQSAEVNAAAGDFYRNTLDTITGAWVRPRTRGWSLFQNIAAQRIRDALTRTVAATEAITRINDDYQTLVQPSMEEATT